MALPLGLETRTQRIIFVTYISLWVSYGLLNELAKRRGVQFNSAAAVVVQSCLKLCLASHMFLTSEAVNPTLYPQSTTSKSNEKASIVAQSYFARMKYLMQQMHQHRKMMLRYFIPSGLYVIYDILSYINLRHFDAPTYFLLLQFRMVITGLLHQLMFQKPLNRNQWISLVVTTLGCAIKTLGTLSTRDNKHTTYDSHPTILSYGLLFCQLMCSTFAGVYNELLLKSQGSVPLNLQNIFMYIDAIICTLGMLILGITGQTLYQVLQFENLSILFSWNVLPMMLIMSCIGVVTSLFLRTLDSIRKAIASALELVFLPILSTVLFATPINGSMIVAIALVSFGVYIYSQPIEAGLSAGSSLKHNPKETDLEKGNNDKQAE